MTANKYTRERKSLCEESMLVLVNILRLSSVSLARNGLVEPKSPSDTTPPNATKKVHPKKPISSAGVAWLNTSDDDNSLDAGASWGNGRSKRAQKPEQGGSNVSYLMLPTTEDDDNQKHEVGVGGRRARMASVRQTPRRFNHVHEVHDGEGKFSDYIRRFHEKAENDLQNATVEGKAAEYIKKFHEKNKKDSKNDSTRWSTYVLPPPPLSDHHHQQQHHHVKSRSFA